MESSKKIVLKSTGAIGDLVIASALAFSLNNLGYHTGIISKSFTLPLWKGLENVSVYDNEEQVPSDASVVDLSDYLENFPYSRMLPLEFAGGESRIGHLCEWMAVSLQQKSGICVSPSRDNVKVVLTREEVEFGRDKIYEVSKAKGNKPVVIISPYSTALNKNLPKTTLETVVNGISSFAVPCLLTPYDEKTQHIDDAVPIGDRDLRKASGILFATNSYLSVDSGPLHMANGAIQGTTFEDIKGIDPTSSKIVAVFGSSHPNAIAYKNNKIISSAGSCKILPCGLPPCGAHGYWPVEQYTKEFDKPFYQSKKDKSGCVFEDYPIAETAKCMEDIQAEEIIETLRDILK